MIFAVQYRKPFYVFSREQCDTKITELLALFGLSDRIITAENQKEQPLEQIDYAAVHRRITDKREQSLKFLHMELTSCL